MRVTKCNVCGVIIDPAEQACYIIQTIQRVDKIGSRSGWHMNIAIDICDTCWRSGMTLEALETLFQSGGVKQNAVPQLNEADKET